MRKFSEIDELVMIGDFTRERFIVNRASIASRIILLIIDNLPIKFQSSLMFS